MSHVYQNNSPVENWQDLVAWEDELYDPIFQGDTRFTGGQGDGLATSYEIPESVTSEQPYLPLAPVSTVDGPPSLEYTVSAPPSIVGGSSSFDHVYSTSPSFDTATSSFGGRYLGSFDACNNGLSPLEQDIDPPILDTRYERIADSFASIGSIQTSAETVLNPYVTASSHSIDLDVSASQVFANSKTLFEQPQVIETIAECDEYGAGVAPIPIPQSYLHSFNNMAIKSPRSAEPQYTHSRAITIPRPHRQPATYNPSVSSSQWVQRVPPVLSVSPVSQRRTRCGTSSRSNSQIESRKKIYTPSPTSLEWVSYQLNAQTNRLMPSSTEGTQSRNTRGRKKGLTAEQRSHAALMRIIGACSNCQRRKEKCDPGTPCRSCLEHYKGDLVKTPCRDRILSDLSSAFLSDRLGWHPTARPPESFVAYNSFNVLTDITYTILLNFGFGPAFTIPVHALQIEGNPTLTHHHVIYSWPPESSTRCTHINTVLPAVLTLDAASHLPQSLDIHLSLLVTHHFRAFPLYCSPLQILREVYIFFSSLSPHKPHSRILHQALKLLVLVHIGGDITLPASSQSTALTQLMRSTMNYAGEEEEYGEPTPCFIRSQFGAIMPTLAISYMKDVLSSLEQLLLNRAPEDWPVALAVLITVLMTVESIHYHAAKMPYHANYGPARPSDLEEDRETDDNGVKTLLALYSACFSGCHARLRPDWEGEAQRADRAEDVFVESVREVVRKASSKGYLTRKAGEKRQGDNMEFFFDRLVARLLLLRL